MGFTEIVPTEVPGRGAYHLLTSLVVPRPIGWVSTVSTSGVKNVAPHSYFNAVSSEPLIVHFTSTGVKDSLVNACATGEFVVNIVSRDLAEAMNLTAANFPPEEDEFSWAGLEAVPSRTVKAPRVGAAKAALECKVVHTLELGNGHMVFGEVQLIVIDESVMRDGRVDPELLAPIGRLSGATYTDTARALFELKRPSYDDVRSEGSR
ncbi:MAG TPA: flavin reductase family protein [Actinomycetota bacterium]|nr:flavin reductase family protein [Actinomycetota bacterium]